MRIYVVSRQYCGCIVARLLVFAAAGGVDYDNNIIFAVRAEAEVKD